MAAGSSSVPGPSLPAAPSPFPAAAPAAEEGVESGTSGYPGSRTNGTSSGGTQSTLRSAQISRRSKLRSAAEERSVSSAWHPSSISARARSAGSFGTSEESAADVGVAGRLLPAAVVEGVVEDVNPRAEGGAASSPASSESTAWARISLTALMMSSIRYCARGVSHFRLLEFFDFPVIPSSSSSAP